MATEQPYEDEDYVEEYRFQAPDPDQSVFLIRHKASRNMFKVLAKDRAELADKVTVGDWEPDPRNEPPPDDEDDEN